MTTPDPITPERVTPHRPVMADPLLVAGHVCQECGRAGDDPEAHPPERVTLTEDERALLDRGAAPTSSNPGLELEQDEGDT